MRVIINQLATGSQKTGIGHYASELVRCLRGLPGTHEVFEYRHSFMQKLRGLWGSVSRGPALAPGEGRRRLSSIVKGQVVNRLRPWGHRLLRQYARLAYTSRHFDLYHEPNFIALPCDLPTVATVHDLSAILHPEWHPPERVARFERYFRQGLAQCRHFLAISEAARQEIIRTLGIAPHRITRTWMGIRPGLRSLPEPEVRAVLARLGLPSRYLLYLGTLEPRKNVLRLLRAYCALPGSLRDRWPLLLVGGWGWKIKEVAEFYHDKARHRGVIHAGYVPDEHVPALYNGARALVYPSLYEGFGLPPVEMMACGGAVLASRIGPHVETVGSRACLVAPEDTGGWHDALQRVLTDNAWWHELRRGAEEVARPFTWEQCAADTLAVYHTVLGRSPDLPALRKAG
jgi:O-antigen biosynthesis alpha-1,3-rhamnosyltransferase